MSMAFLDIGEPQFLMKPALRVAGLVAHYLRTQAGDIPSLWQRLGPHLGRIPGQVGSTAYGVIFNASDDGNFDYLAGVEVTAAAQLPPTLVELRVPAQRYALFTLGGHITTMRSAFNTVWNRWLPASGHHLAQAPVLECYPPRFDATTGNGGYEIWVPLKD